MKILRFILSVPAILMAVSASAQYRTDVPYHELYDSETASALRTHVSTLASASMEGRRAGSEGELAAAEYVAEVLEKYGVDVLSGRNGELFGIKSEGGDTLRSRNVVGFVHGYDKTLKNSYIVVGARLDNMGTMKVTIDGESTTRTFYGANGNASGLAMMLELAKKISTNSIMFRRSVLFVAFGASEVMNAGSWYFLNRSFADAAHIDAMINLDMLGTGGSGFYAYTGSNADLNALVQNLSQELQPVNPTVTAAEPFASDHRSFYEFGIPAVTFTTGRYPEYRTERDTPSIIDYQGMERELEYLYNFTVAAANGPKPAFDPSEDLKRKRNSSDSIVPYYECDTKPTFFGHADPSYFTQKWVYQYLKYPEACVRDGIQGRVLVSFIIDEKGKVSDARVVKSVDPLLDDEAVRVINASPDWKPGKVKGNPVKTEMSLYVEFRLEKKHRK